MAIHSLGNLQKTQQALDDWYLAPKKDYEAFAKKYPMNGELNQQYKTLEKMSEWCNKAEIQFTPTIFINGKQLPNNYNVNELKYIL
ncbi:MAG: thioredoxin domain-containing protein [Chitinophagaceae bacterium]|nr:thioredoxin domain-containing protein [Chitinophagaceae bacterium]